MICKKCGVKIPENAESCPLCGTPVTEVEKPEDFYREGQDDTVEELQNKIKEREQYLRKLQLQYEQQKVNYDKLIGEKKKLLFENEKTITQIEGSIQEKRIKARSHKAATRKPETVSHFLTAQEGEPNLLPAVEKRNYKAISAAEVIVSFLGILAVLFPWGTIVTRDFRLIDILGIFDHGYLIDELLDSLNDEASMILLLLRLLCVCCFVPAILYGIHIYRLLKKERYSFCGSAGACVAIFCGVIWFFLIAMIVNKVEEGVGYFISISDKVIEPGGGLILSVICGISVLVLERFRRRERMRIDDLEAGKSADTLRKKTGKKETYIVKNFQPFLSARIPGVTFSGDKREFVSVNIVNYSSEVLQGILLDIDVENMFGEIYRIRDCRFELTLWKDYKGIQTKELYIKSWDGALPGEIKNVRVYIQKLVYPGKVVSAVQFSEKTAEQFTCDDMSIDIPEGNMRGLANLRRNLGADAVEDWGDYPDHWNCPCGMENGSDMTHCFICGRERKRGEMRWEATIR